MKTKRIDEQTWTHLERDGPCSSLTALTEYLGYSRYSMYNFWGRNKILRDARYAFSIPYHELPLHISDTNDIVRRVAQRRLEKE